MKRSAFVFRTIGCAPDAKAEVNATAEGLVNAQRRSMPLKVALGPAANVFGIFPEWPADGTWIVNIQARCGAKWAGALVATDGKGLVREASTLLDHAATAADIDASLKRGKKIEGRLD